MRKGGWGFALRRFTLPLLFSSMNRLQSTELRVLSWVLGDTVEDEMVLFPATAHKGKKEPYAKAEVKNTQSDGQACQSDRWR